ncbi:alpha/beta hydrolase [Lentilactobacillus diolivorans]|uniref:alpha/beta fold hydrolase n=1 Tax=Lentilactobacillus diolivorans TaxID=179838 RepID=UPI00246965EE|nr:alpha/beta hydrolase [Lentilactobacillus diolivorans]MDH5106880.1 alpha/beta hydrolase [Lentilactobacillus diolivorans]
MNQIHQTGNEVAYLSVGTGTPIIFLHGLALDHHSTVEFFEPFLKDSDYRRIYIDLPGMGETAALTSATSDQILESIMIAIREVVGNQKFIIYGHSFGGYLARATVSRFPNQILGMFLTCPVITADHTKRKVGKHVNIIQESVTPAANQDYWDDFLDMNVVINQASWQAYQRLIIPGLQNADLSFINKLEATDYQLSCDSEIREIQFPFPLEIMVGKNDHVVGYQEQSELVNHSSLAKLVLLNQAGHNLMIDQPEAVRVQLKQFLDDLTL